MKHSELTSAIIGICIEVHKTLGPGLLESVYEGAICYELTLAGFEFTRQQPIRVIYKGKDLDLGFRADVIVENSVLLEIKSIERIVPVHKKIALTYLRLIEIEVGLMVNFNVAQLTEGLTRLVLDRRDRFHATLYLHQ